MATITEEKFLATATVLTEEETQALDTVLEDDPEPATDDMVQAFSAALKIKAA